MRFLFALAPALLVATGVADAAGKAAPLEDLIASNSRAICEHP